MSTESAKSAKVYGVFARISRQYDRMNDLISFGRHRAWKRDILRQVVLTAPERALDLCCGTGDVSLLLAKNLPQAFVSGLDFSPAMLEVAQNRCRDFLDRNLTLIEGDAMQTGLPDASFDCITISMGLRNLPDYELALREIYRLLKPGGGFYCLDTSLPRNLVWRGLFRFYFHHIMPFLGQIVAGSRKEYQWLASSTDLFLSKEQLTALMREVGFAGVGYTAYSFGTAACHVGYKR